MEANNTTPLFTANEVHQLTWLQLSLLVGVLGEFFITSPASYVATAILFLVPIALWLRGGPGSAIRSCSGGHLLFIGMNYVAYPILVFCIMSHLAFGSIKAGSDLLAIFPDKEISFVMVTYMMLGAIPPEMELARLTGLVCLVSLGIFYLRLLLCPLLNIYRANKQKELLYPNTI